ncbi:protein of unknown function [Candidatus Hydrogenisulfobacillus filiaventi]|uniref:Uncharacterized protein n=1 Tax=Candidatus Hydrogenisulfobacillus filiaventi TaxID=2707344 RepID=A0A6F8ZFZ0_9FIRM|nr:protein of unknown function [Candidatus Hydrogenisulfobacillus filiaventi]
MLFANLKILICYVFVLSRAFC